MSYGSEKVFIYTSGGSVDHDWVDLGLPSGTLWAKCNVGATKPEDYGIYFGCDKIMAKDYINWNSDWCKPTNDQWTELCNHTSQDWTELNGVSGYRFTASNGESIFLPATSCFGNDDYSFIYGVYWSSSWTAPNEWGVQVPYFFQFTSGFYKLGPIALEEGAVPIRAVRC